MQQPLVSIIVPIYNAALDLVRCLESIKRQRYENLEILLVNDGSSDSSLEICRMYARLDPRIIVIDKENSGVSGTRNLAIERASGKYLQFVDADDHLDPNAVRLMVEAMEENESDLVIASYCSVTPGGKTRVYSFLPPDRRLRGCRARTMILFAAWSLLPPRTGCWAGACGCACTQAPWRTARR